MKTRRKLFSVLLAFCMVTTLFTGVPANAAWDDNYEQKGDAEITPVFGLIATQYLSYEGDNLLTKDGYPAEPEDWGDIENTLHPIDYSDENTVSITGGRFWFDYRDSVDGERTHATAKDITVKYYPDRNPDDENATVENKTDVLRDGEDGVVIFIPHADEFGLYRLFYKNKTEYFNLYLEWPNIGFYSAPERSAENLLLDDYSSNGTSDYSMYYGGQNVVYMNAHGDKNRELRFPTTDDLDAHEDWNPAFTVDISNWEKDERQTLKGNADGIDNYLTVEELEEKSDAENNDHWYKLTFSEEMDVDGEKLPINDFNLNVTMLQTESWMEYNEETDEEEPVTDGPNPIDAWFSGAYHSLGLTATVDNEVYTVDNWIGTSLVYPKHFKISFKETYMDDEGKVQSRAVDTAKMKLEKDKNYGLFDEDGNPKEANWGVATDDECTKTIKDGEVDCVFHFQGMWRFSFGKDEYIYINSYLDDVAFFKTPNRPADSEPVNNRLAETTVDEGKTQKIYALAWRDDDSAWAPKTDTIAIKAYVGDTEKPAYIKVDKTATTDNREVNPTFGYGVEITDAATEDFTIVVTAERNCINIYRDEEGNETEREELSWMRDEEGIRCEFPVKVNKIKELKIATPPKKTTYAEGETFSSEGMVVNAVYADGKKEAITGYSVSPNGKLSASDTSVKISYLGKQVSQAITVTAKQSLTRGEKAEDSKTGNRYKVTNASAKNPTVEYTAPKKDAKGSVTIPDTVTINGTKCKVTSIAANAFKNNKKVTKVTVGKNITSIGKNAFSGCKKLKNIVIKSTKLSSKNVKKDAFKGINKKTTIKVPKKNLKAYKKLFQKKGLSKKVKITK